MYEKPISYSGLKLFEKCPRRWYDQYVLGNRYPSGPAADRGTQKHTLLEEYFTGAIAFPHGDSCISPWHDYMSALLARNPVAEGEVAVRRDWSPCGFDDPTAYFRGKKDLHVEDGSILELYDWKTGKMYPEHVEQGESYVAMSDPKYEEFIVRFAYLDMPHVVKEWRYARKDQIILREKYTNKVEIIRNATDFPPKPSEKNCDWCHLSWRRGGNCEAAP